MSLKDLGKSLKVKREEKNLTLNEIAESTRIPLRYLEAIESGDLSLLPGPPYDRAFVKQYARILELEFDQVAAALDHTADIEERLGERKRSEVPFSDKHGPVRSILQWVGVALFLAAFGVMIGSIIDSDGRNVALRDSERIQSQPGESKSQPGALDGVELIVDVLQDCWFAVVADGETLFTGTLEAGAQVTWSARDTLQVRYGNPEGVRITLNGDYLGVPGTGVITRLYSSNTMD